MSSTITTYTGPYTREEAIAALQTQRDFALDQARMSEREQRLADVKARLAACPAHLLADLKKTLAREMMDASKARMAADYEELVVPILPAKKEKKEKAPKVKKPTKKELREAEERADSKTGRTLAELHADCKKARETGRTQLEVMAERLAVRPAEECIRLVFDGVSVRPANAEELANWDNMEDTL